jgi:ABC-2 type transport system permease protein
MTPTTPTSPSSRSMFAWLIADSSALAGRSIRHELRRLDGLLVTVLLPLLVLLAFVYVFGGALQTPGSYIDYVVPGIVVLTSGYGAALTAPALTQDLTTSMIDRLRALPASPAALFAGHVTAAVLRTLFSAVLVISVAIGLGFDARASLLAWIGAIGMVTLYILAIAWVAVVVGVAARSVEAASGFSFLVLFLPYVSSGFVPPETLPPVLRAFAVNQPLTPVIETLRALLLGTDAGDHGWRALAWCSTTVALAIPASALLFRRRTRR